MSQTVLCTKSSSLLVTWWSLETLTTPNKKKIQSCGSQTVEPPIQPDSYLWTTEDDFQRWCVYWSHLYCGYTHAITTWPQTLFLLFAKLITCILLSSPRLDTKQCTYLEVALQLLANEFVVEDAASNWKTGPLRLLHYTLERQKHRERTVSGQTQDRVHNSQQPTIVIGSHPALDTWWCCNKSGFYPDSIKLQRVFILTERITADEPLFNVGLNILRNIWRQLVF